jgi:hypothetical protein
MGARREDLRVIWALSCHPPHPTHTRQARTQDTQVVRCVRTSHTRLVGGAMARGPLKAG